MNLQALAEAVRRHRPSAVLADVDGDFAYFVDPDERGLRRVAYASVGRGQMALAEPESMRLRPAAERRPVIMRTMLDETREPAAASEDANFAPLRPSVFDKPEDLQRRAAAARAAAEHRSNLAALAEADSDENFAPLPPSIFDRPAGSAAAAGRTPAAASQDADFAPLKPSLWR